MSHNKWEKNTVHDLWRSYFREGEISTVGKGFFSIFGIVISILSMTDFAPALVVMIIFLVNEFGFSGVVSLILVLLIFSDLNRAIKERYSLIQLRSLARYLLTALEHFHLSLYKLEDYLDDQQIDRLRTSRVFSLFNEAELGHVITLTPKEIGLEATQRKGFIVPIAYTDMKNYSYRRVTIKPLSTIFLRDNPEDIKDSITGLFQLYHEIGHMTKYSFDIVSRRNIAIKDITLLSLVVILYGGLSYSLFWFLPYMIYKFFVEANRDVNAEEEEYIADISSVKEFPQSKLKRLQRIIPKLTTINSNRKRRILQNIETRSSEDDSIILEDRVVLKNRLLRFVFCTLLIVGSIVLEVKSNWWNTLVLFVIYVFSEIYLVTTSQRVMGETRIIKDFYSTLERVDLESTELY